MLDTPEMMAAFAAQLRRMLSDQAAFVARVRRDAEAMWKANPPDGYSTFEAWWRHRWLTGPFGEIQEHMEKAAEKTFQLEARYRRGRHEIPERKAAAAQARQQPALTGGEPAGQPRRAERRETRPAAAAADGDFMAMIRREGRSA
ncbi:hypothetical protein [Nonomuraea sp. NPDC049646]|uniref:hypothetical protein n=1 Tax=unclassified Nonomuraea TaxID=2593643 RepID=UPI003793E658